MNAVTWFGSRTSSTCFALLLAATTCVASADDALMPDPSLVGHWTFDEGTGLLAADASGNGRPGTLMAAPGGAIPTWIADGIHGAALHFDGSGYVDIAGTASEFNFGTGGFSLAAWVRYGTLEAWEYMIVGKHSGGYTNGYFLDVGRDWDPVGNANRLDFYFHDDPTRVLTSGTYDDQRWHFVVGTNDGATGKLYVDGVYIGSNPGSPIDNGVDLLIGGIFQSNGLFNVGFSGDIDDVRVYHRALTDIDVQQLYGAYTSEVGYFDPAADFSAASNPNGAWSYGWSATLGSPLNLYPDRITDCYGLDGWNDEGIPDAQICGSLPGVFHNNTENTISFSGIVVQPGELGLHPGAAGQYSIVRWRAPTAGVYSLLATFDGHQACGVGTTTDVHVLHNDVSVFDGAVLGAGDTSSMPPFSLWVGAGETIDFSVGFGNNVYYCDYTGLAAGIARIPTLGADVQVSPSYQFAIETGASRMESIHLFNSGDVPRSATLQVANPSPDLGVTLPSQGPFILAPGEAVEVPLIIDASSSPVGTYDGLLLEVAVDDGSTLYSSIKVNVTEPGVMLPDLVLTTADLSVVSDPADGTLTLRALVHNRGAAPASGVVVTFHEYDRLLGSTVIDEIPANGSAPASIDVPVTGSGDHVYEAKVDPDGTIPELDETNNETTWIIPWNTPVEMAGHILVTGSLPTTVYAGSLFSVAGQAVYNIYIYGVRNTDYVVKGGSVEVTVKAPDGTAWLYGGIYTDVNGQFRKALLAPSVPGIYRILMTVSDTTFTGTRELVVTVVEAPTLLPDPPPPPTTTGTGYWSYDGTVGEGIWTWIWTIWPVGEPVVDSDLWIHSEDLYFSDTRPDAGEEITVVAELHYWASSTSLVAEDIPVNIYATYPGTPRERIGQTVIPSLSVGAPDYGSRYVFATWRNSGDGIYLVEVEIDPSYVEENPLNNAATRAIIVGEVASGQGAISGQVTNPWGGAKDVIVSVYETDGSLLASTVTDATGFYLVGSVPMGEMEVRIAVPAGYVADAESKLVSVADQVVSDVDFVLTVAPADAPPVLSLPGDMAVEATGPGGAVVVYTASADDAVDGPITPICNPGSGSTFALGTTNVSCSATDQAGNTATGSFNVTVRDTTPPTVMVPADISAEATGPAGAAVTFSASATDLVSGPITPICSPASGTTFALDTTNVTCTAMDQAGNTATGIFHVTVRDTTPPTVTVPADLGAETMDPTGTVVIYEASATDLVDGVIAPMCEPASGSLFAVGKTAVSCSAADSHGNTGSADFDVTVELVAAPDQQPPVVSAVQVTPDPAPIGTALTLTASVDDGATGGSIIIAADYQIDGGDWVAMNAVDGGFDSPLEAVQANVTFLEEGPHSICVRGSDAAGNVSAGACVTVSTACSVPESPTGLKAVLSRNDVRLSWSASADAEGYVIYRRVNGQDPFAVIGTSTQTTFRDRDYAIGADFNLLEYYVVAQNDCGASDPSAVVTLRPRGRK